VPTNAIVARCGCVAARWRPMVPSSALPQLADLTSRTSHVVRQLHGCLDPLSHVRTAIPIEHDLAAIERELAWLISKLQCALLDTAHQARTRAS
jgi:hypothetical protein